MVKLAEESNVSKKEGIHVKPSSSVNGNFPRNSLNESLRVAEVIWQNNAGIPYPLLDIAKKLNYSPTSYSYRSLIRSAQRYGLTNETYSQELKKTVSLSPLGKSIVAPMPDEDVNSLKRKSLETPEIFGKVLIQLDGKILPPDDSFKNLLIRTYSLSVDDSEACYDILIKNIDELGLLDDVQGKRYLRLDMLGTGRALPPSPDEVESNGNNIMQPSRGVTGESEDMSLSGIPKKPVETSKIPKVFISHSKNKAIVTQIKEMLEFGEFEYQVAEERETLAIPLSEKVFGFMEKCNCAIINISADEEKKQADSSYTINENVLIEIGAAYLHYKRRVILLIDNRLVSKLPSNIKELVSIRYEGDELSWNAGRQLQNALKEFRSQL